MAPLKVLVTGATGYVGGSILARIQNSIFPQIKALSYTVLVRKPEQADYYKSIGITPISFDSLDQSDLLKKTAAEHDIVINTASAAHGAASRALIDGLGERKKATGKPVYFVHTSGTSSVGSRPLSKAYVEDGDDHEFSDKTDDIYAYLLKREAIEPYPQRTGDIAVLKAGEEFQVPTYIIMSPLIYGLGTGAYNKHSIQIPLPTQRALAFGFAEYLGEGTGVWDHTHVEDTAAIYELLLKSILAGENPPSGRKGIYFASSGRQSWKELAERIGKAGFELGVLKDATPKSATLEQFAAGAPGYPLASIELGFASRSVTNADLTREVLGWKPQKTEQDWDKTFKDEFEYVIGAAKAAQGA